MSKKPADDAFDDPAARVRNVLDAGIAAIEKQMLALTEAETTAARTTQIVALTKDAATIMSHCRRFDQAQREETRRLTPSLVVAYLRGLMPDQRNAILAELGNFITDSEDVPEGNVLS